MPFVDTNELTVVERLPGWKGRYFHSASMTFAHYEFTAGSSIHEHFHPEEEVYEVIGGTAAPGSRHQGRVWRDSGGRRDSIHGRYVDPTTRHRFNVFGYLS